MCTSRKAHSLKPIANSSSTFERTGGALLAEHAAYKHYHSSEFSPLREDFSYKRRDFNPWQFLRLVQDISFHHL